MSQLLLLVCFFFWGPLGYRFYYCQMLPLLNEVLPTHQQVDCKLYFVFWTLARHVTFYLLRFQKRAGNMASRKNQNIAIPLCLPNNCQWNAATGEYIKTEGQRTSLYVVEEALKKLRTVKGVLSVHVFTVISYILYVCPSSSWTQWELCTCNH